MQPKGDPRECIPRREVLMNAAHQQGGSSRVNAPQIREVLTSAAYYYYY